MGYTDFALGNEWATLRNGLKSTGRSKRVAKGDAIWKKGDTFGGGSGVNREDKFLRVRSWVSRNTTGLSMRPDT